MNVNNDPPTYEESNSASHFVYKEYFTSTRGPDNIFSGSCSLIADFIPWTEFHACEDMGYLLLRANDWLRINHTYGVKKCEMVPRMVNSKSQLEVSNCYIFNMTCGRTLFVNQLRIHIKIDESKSVADEISLHTIIPELVQDSSRYLNSARCLRRLLLQRNELPIFEEMSDVLLKLNNMIQDCTITGRIISISTFYLNLSEYLSNNDPKFQDKVSFFEEPNRSRCHLKCLRVFYNHGLRINKNIGVQCFRANEESIRTLNDLVNTALNWIWRQNNQNFISLETFQEYSGNNTFGAVPTENYFDSTFICTNKCSTYVRKEVVNVFYFSELESPTMNLRTIDKITEIIWITPRKFNNIYETYDSFMEYLKFVFVTYDEFIYDVESLIIPNPLSWRSIRYQTLKRYVNDNATNYQIYTIRMLVKVGVMTLPFEDAPLPFISPTKYSMACNLL